MSFVPLTELLDRYQPFDDLEALHVTQLRQHLRESSNPFDRKNLLGHTVADAWIVNPERTHVLLLVHGDSGMWLTPGGHTDGSPDMHGAAVREVEEETGLPRKLLKPLNDGNLYDINVAGIETRKKSWGVEPVHLHFDICFAFETQMSHPLQISDESRELGWQTVGQAMEKVIPEHQRRVHKMLKGLI